VTSVARARPVIIDCDPGQDDAVNLLLAFASPEEIEIRGVTTVAGNVPLEKTERNARLMCELAGRHDVRVYSGCPAPMLRPLMTAEYVHGREGIDGADVYEPEHRLEEAHAVDFIIETLLESDDDGVTLMPTGPLTNVAMAIVREPKIIPKIRDIVLMGGASREGGNVTPSAEFNIYVDPHAAKIVFGCGRPLVALGLDVTHQVLATRQRVAAIAALGNRAGRSVAAMLDFSGRYDQEKYSMPGGPLHDPCTTVYFLRPNLFRSKLVNIEVETVSELTMGETAVDLWGVTGREPNALWVDEVDAEGFYSFLTERLSRLP